MAKKEYRISKVLKTGNANDEVLRGTGDADKLYGRGGDDTINGAGGNDRLFGGLSNDVLNGGTGNDSLFGGDGADMLYGWTGRDLLNAGAGADKLYGGADADVLNGGAGADSLFGGSGADVLNGGAGADTMLGGVGNDTFIAQGNDLIFGNDGRDTVLLSANYEDLTFTKVANGFNVTGGGETVKVRGVEWFQFADGTVMSAAAIERDVNPDLGDFRLAKSADAVSEGGTVLFTLDAGLAYSGAQFDYAIGGVSAADVVGGTLSGTATIGADGKAVIRVQLVADRSTEGAETLTLAVAGQSQSVTVTDTSLSPTYVLEKSADAVAEGGVVVFTLATTNVDAGSTFDYRITGVDAADVVGGALTGTATIGADGKAEIRVQLVADRITEGAEELTLAVAGRSQSVTVTDTSLSPTYVLEKSADAVAEGGLAVFTLLTTNVDAGSTFDYQITGVDAADVVGGALTGTATIGADGKAEIRVQLVADRVTEGAETLTLAVAGKSQSVTVTDTSLDPTYVLEKSADAVAEGGVVVFTLLTTNVDAGSTFDYRITGVDAADVVGGALTGTATVGADGKAEIRVQLVADRVTEGAETLTLAVAGKSQSVTVTDTSVDPVFEFTGNTDLFVDANAGSSDDNIYVGRVGSSFNNTGTATTFQDGDAVDGGEGRNTLRLFMEAGSRSDGVDVDNIQVLDLRLTATQANAIVTSTIPADPATELFMTDWDDSLQQIDIRSNKSNLIVHEQQTIADVSISDQSTEDRTSSYDFRYAAGVLDGNADHLDLSVDNVNGDAGAAIKVDAGMEAVTINVADREGDQYASDVNLTAGGVDVVAVTGGRTGQNFTLDADVATGASLTSTAFAGDLNLTSADIKTANLGSGSDIVTITGQADDPTSLYQMGAGNNSLTIGSAGTPLNLAGDVTSGDGNDTVTVNGNTIATLTARSSINVGGSDNTMGNTVTITGAHAGDVVAGNGRDTVTVNSTAAGSTISVGNGTNRVTVTTNHAGEIVGGDNSDTVTAASTAAGSLIALGGGGNSATITGAHAGQINGLNGADNVRVGSTVAGSTIALNNGQNIVTVDTTHAGSITTGVNEDTVTVGSSTSGGGLVTGTITTGDGTDRVTVYGDVTDASINLGDGNNNELIVTGTISRTTPPATIVFGDGDDNLLDVGGNITNESVQFGTGSGNRVELDGNLATSTMIFAGDASVVTIGRNVTTSTVSLGNGANIGTIVGNVAGGSTITFGEGPDQLTLGDGGTNSPNIQGTSMLTSVSMGGEDDHVTIIGKHTGTTTGLVKSGALLDGGDGTNDQLTIRAVDDLVVTARDTAQELTINLARTDSNNYAIGDVVTVTIAGTAYSYEVRAADIIQGDGVATSRNVAEGVAAAIPGGAALADELPAAPSTSSVITLTGAIGNADVAVTASVTRGTVVTEIAPTVIQIANAEVRGFETLNLVATNPLDVDNDTASPVDAGDTDNERNSADISADFALITGVQNVNLVSQVETIVGPGQTLASPLAASGYLVTSYTPGVGVTSGTLTTLEKVDAGDPNVFTLTNLSGSEAISVEANEINATGNRQIDRITINGTADTYKVGDKITVAIGTATVTIEVTESELTPGNAPGVDANIIATKLAAAINGHLASISDGGVTGVDAYVSGNLVIIAGESGANVGTVDVTHARPAEATISSSGTVTGDITLGAVGSTVTVANTAIVYDVNSQAATNGLTDVERYQVGDLLTFNIGAGQVTYRVQQADLEADCNRIDLDTLTANIANAIANSSIAGTANVEASFDGVITGVPGTYSWTHTREIDAAQDLTATTLATNLLQESATDDGTADVTLNATRAAGSTDSTMELTVDGRGDFDLTFTANATNNGYTDLSMTLADEFGHTIDLNGGVYTGTVASTGIVGNFSNSVTVVDEEGRTTAGQDIVLSEVLASTVNTVGADADFTLDQYTGVRDAATGSFAGEEIEVTTGSGNEHLTTLAQSALETGSTIDLGDGSNTLSLGWGGGATLNGAHLEDVGDIAYAGSLNQLDILNNVVLDQESTTLAMPGTDEVETVTFTNVDPTGGQANDLTIQGVENDVRIESAGNFDLGLAGTVVGGNPNTSNLRYDVTETDDVPGGIEANFNDQFSSPGDSVTVQINVGNRIFGASEAFDFAPGVKIPVPPSFNGTGDDRVHNEQIEIYYGTYDAETKVFTVTMTPNSVGYPPAPEVAPSHTLGLYDNALDGTVDYIEGIVFKGFFEEGGFFIDETTDPWTLQWDGEVYIPYSGGSEGGGEVSAAIGTDVGVLTLTDENGVENTGNASVDAVTAVRFNIGNNDLASLTVKAGDDADIYVAGNTAGTYAIDALSITAGSATGDDASLTVVDNTGTTLTLGDVDVDGNTATITVEGNTSITAMVTGDVALSAVTYATLHLGDGFDNDTVGNRASTISVAGGVSLQAGDLASLSVDGNTFLDTATARTDSNVTVSGNIVLEGKGDTRNNGNAAALEVIGNTRTNVSLADNGTIELVACGNDDDTRVTVGNNLNNFVPEFGNPDNEFINNRSYAINLGDVLADSGRDAIVTLQNNDDTTYYGELSVTVDSVDLFAYRNAVVEIGGIIVSNSVSYNVGNDATTITVGNVDMVSQLDGTLSIIENDGGIYSFTPPSGPATREVDFASITLGDVTIKADAGNVTDTVNFGAATVNVDGNDRAKVVAGVVDLSAGGNATFNINNQDDTATTVQRVTMVAGNNVALSISDNDRFDTGATTVPALASSVTINGPVSTTAGAAGTTAINIDDNDGLNATERSTVSVNGSFTSTGGSNINASIRSNQFATINLGGTAVAPVVNLSSAAGYSWLGIDDNSDTVLTLAATTLQANGAGNSALLVIGDEISGDSSNVNTDIIIASLTVDANADIASVLVKDNDGGTNKTDVIVTGGVTIDGSSAARLEILDNSDVNVFLALADTVKMDARTTAVGSAVFDLSGNTSSTIVTGLVDIDAADTVDFDVRSNVYATVGTGAIDIDAGGRASFDVVGNTNSVFDLAAVVTRDSGYVITGITRNTITIDADSVGSYGDAGNGTAWGVEVSGNSASEVILGNLTVTATDQDVANGNDVTLGIFATNDELIDVGNITLNADNDIWAQISNSDFGAGANVRTGDISITSGLEPEIDGVDQDLLPDNPDVSSNLYFVAIGLEGNDLNDNSGAGDNGQQITLTANNRGTGEGHVYAQISNAPDLTNLTVIGGGSVDHETQAEVYLTGNIGGDTAGTSMFTLDLSGLTGKFDGGATSFDPRGIGASNNLNQDDGSYVETWNANFGSDIVRVEIGSGDLIYNAQHSEFGGSPSEIGALAENDWENGEDSVTDEGWFSLNDNGNARYLSPVVAQQTITLDRVDVGDPNAETWFASSVIIQTESNREFAIVNVAFYDDSSPDEGWSSQSITFYELAGGSYSAVAESVVEAAMGVEISQGSVAGDHFFTFSGQPDGTNFDMIAGGTYDARVGGFGSAGAAIEAVLTGAATGNLVSSVTSGVNTFQTRNGIEALDGVGNLAKETFVFTGSEVGEVVLGGFNAGAWGSANPDNGRLTDRLDFSGFDWNGNGQSDDAGLVDLSYFNISVEDGDGYFADVVIDFIGGANLAVGDVDFGSVRLVGVGEFNNAVSVVQDSFIFV